MPDSTAAILAVDQSTAATKAVVFDAKARLVAEAARTHPSVFPQPGWVEQDPEQLYRHTLEVMAEAASGAATQGFHLVAAGVTNQRETVVVWDRRTGRAVAPALGWQCVRGQEITARWRSAGLADRIKASTGLPLDPHFSASKIAWVLESPPSLASAAREGHLAFGTVDSWLIYRLTGGRVHATDCSNASRTMLFALAEGRWDQGLFEAFGIPLSMAPEVKMSDGDFGSTDLEGALKAPLPLRGVMGDSHAALFGLGCHRAGEAKATYGTGSSVMLNVGTRIPRDSGALAVSAAWGLGGRLEYVLEGNIHHSGDTLRWLVEDLGLFRDLDEWSALADATASSEGVYLVPAFSGLGAPWWDEGARGALVGLTRGSGKGHVARAALESLAYQVTDLLDAMRSAAGTLDRLSVDGGPTRNRALMQFQADTGRVSVSVSGTSNASVWGIAAVAGVAAGLWSGPDEVRALVPPAASYRPCNDLTLPSALVDGWRTAVRRVRG